MSHRIFPIVFIGLALCAPPLRAAELPPHPRLLVDARDVAELKARIASEPWARTRWAGLKAEVNEAIARPVELPPRGGNWSHNYVCPEHGARLIQGRAVGPWQWEHRCPVGPHALRGNPEKAVLDFDGCAIRGVHSDNAHLVVQAGLLYQVAGDTNAAAFARRMLLAYADRYFEYPLHDNQGRPGRGGRIASQSLTEAGWITQIAQGADLVWNTLSEAERARVANGILRPALKEILLPSRLGVHNIQCHLNSAIGLTGYLLGDEDLVRTAIDDPRCGFRTQMEKGVRADGMWCEGSSGYHFYTISGCLPLLEAARHAGLDLYVPAFKRMFDAPLAQASPLLTLPNFNDSGTVSLRNEAPVYEIALARFHDPAYAALVRAGGRRGEEALLRGVPSTALAGAAAAAAPDSRNMPDSGYAILQHGTGEDATWLCLKYGPHGGGHGHFDKLHFVLYARGRVVMPDGGTHAYGAALHKDWDKTSLAHNTLVVDGKTQAAAAGRCVAFGRTGDVDYVCAEAGPVYDGVGFTRTVALCGTNLIVVVDQVRADTPRQLDLVVHLGGRWAPQPSGNAWTPPALEGYCALQDMCQQRGPAWFVDVTPGWTVALAVAGDVGTLAIAGSGPGASVKERVPVAIFRRTTKQTAYVWALALDGVPPALQLLGVRDEAGAPLDPSEAAAVCFIDGARRLTLLANPGGKSVRIGDWHSSKTVDVQ